MPTIRIAGKRDLSVVRLLAEKIWPATYAHILDAEQIDYMMEQIYSTESLRKQAEEYRHVFLILDYHQEPSGFASYSADVDEKRGNLQKIYIDPELQGKGLGKFLLEEVKARVKVTGCSTLQLNVNRHNKARYFYERMGFTIIREENIDIGKGFWMNDYVMETRLTDE
jgi:GNAT superfamily N-acetyltransferase